MPLSEFTGAGETIKARTFCSQESQGLQGVGSLLIDLSQTSQDDSQGITDQITPAGAGSRSDCDTCVVKLMYLFVLHGFRWISVRVV